MGQGRGERDRDREAGKDSGKKETGTETGLSWPLQPSEYDLRTQLILQMEVEAWPGTEDEAVS